jgi:osmotically-inducible protein OsmY
MKQLLVALFASCLVVLSGCGSILATFQTDTIEDHPAERTVGQLIEDDNIETKAIVNIHAADESFHEAHIVVVSYNGYVLLAGQVKNEALKTRATTVVRKVHGVRRIYNELEISAPSSGITRTSDTWITAKVKAWLLGSTNIDGTSVKVVTENGVVYLMGLTTADEAERISNKAAGISGVQRVVRLFELLK